MGEKPAQQLDHLGRLEDYLNSYGMEWLMSSSFYVNELPRLFDANPQLNVMVETNEKGLCHLEIDSEVINVSDCRTAGEIYEKLFNKTS